MKLIFVEFVFDLEISCFGMVVVINWQFFNEYVIYVEFFKYLDDGIMVDLEVFIYFEEGQWGVFLYVKFEFRIYIGG